MKVHCKECKVEMHYPYRVCKNCGWKPTGEFLKKANIFAINYEKEHGITPKKIERNFKDTGPGLLRPPPSDHNNRSEQAFNLERIDCPECGEGMKIPSLDRPVNFICMKCGAKIKILDPKGSSKGIISTPTTPAENVICPKCGKEIIIVSPTRPVKISCKKCGVKIRIID